MADLESSVGGEDPNELPVEQENPEEVEDENTNPFAEDESDEDEVQVTIGEIRPTVQFTKSETRTTTTAGKLDLDHVPTIDGTVIYDVDLAAVDDKPWRKPGADVSDYFNYGFTEETWNMYCERQKKLRAEYGGNQSQVNKYIMSNIAISNPLAPATGSSNISTIGGGASSGVKVLVDNGGQYHLGKDKAPIIRTVINPLGGGGGSSMMGSTPLMHHVPTDFSKPPPTMIIPTVTVGGDQSSSEPPPPGSEEATGTPANPQTIPTLGGGPIGTIDTSMPPPGFDPSRPPPGMTMGMPPTNMPPPNFNPLMPPPQFRGGFQSMPGGRPMGRPPPLLGRDQYGDFADMRRDSGEYERDRRRDDRRGGGDDDDGDDHHRRHRKRSRTPPVRTRSSRARVERDERGGRGGGDRERESGGRSRRHRSRSSSNDGRSRKKEKDERERRERKRDRGDDDDRKKRRHEKEGSSDKTSERKRSRRSRRDEPEEDEGGSGGQPEDTASQGEERVEEQQE